MLLPLTNHLLATATSHIDRVVSIFSSNGKKTYFTLHFLQILSFKATYFKAGNVLSATGSERINKDEFICLIIKSGTDFCVLCDGI